MKTHPKILFAPNLRQPDWLRSPRFDTEPLRDLALLCDRLTAAANRDDDRLIYGYLAAVEGLARASLNNAGWSQLARASVGIEVDLANAFGARNSTALFITILWQEVQKTNQEN
jgi:hypothetical protein